MINKESRFRGFEVTEKKFERQKVKCSECVKDSCGVRDCNLEMFKLGDDEILSGGICPKGNSGIVSKKAPDYIRMYLNILDKHLEKFSKPLDDKSDNGPRVLIPRQMTFLNEQGVFYSSLYSHLGFDVRISPESNEEISNLGKINSHSEFCYPIILGHGHSMYLKEKMRGEDKILLINAISATKDKLKFCPYVASAGFVMSSNIGLDKNKVLLPIIYFNDKNHRIDKAVFMDLERVFPGKFRLNEVKNAVKKAEEDNNKFLKEVYDKGKKVINELIKRKEKIYVGIGRGYTLFDSKASSDVHKLFADNGLYFIPSYMIDIGDKDVKKIVENMYWYQGKKMLEHTWNSMENKNMFPVRLTNFNCGPDSIIHYHEEKLANDFNKPWLVLETDGHNSNAQFGTRILAHNRVVDKYIEKPEKSNFKKLIERDKKFYGRKIGFPYMGDSSDVVSAGFEYTGFETEVIPTRTKESIEIAKKIINTNTCHPFAFQVGDQIAWLESYKKKGVDVNKKLAMFILSAKGPCRFGQYNIVLRNLFDERGFNKVPIINPCSTNDYTDIELSPTAVSKLTRLLYKSIAANDILKNALFRIRPYEINKGETDRVYKKAHFELVDLVKKNPSVKDLVKFLEEKFVEFNNIIRNDEKRFPLVLMNGEIFVRAHEKANLDSARILEKHGLEVIIEPIFSWADYINQNVIRKSKKDKKIGMLAKSLIKRAYINHINKNFSKPFMEILKGRESHDVFHLMEDVEENQIFHHSTEGEGGITIAGANAFVKDKMAIDGIYHVGPMGCMQETIATSRIQSLIQEQRKKSGNKMKVIPFMDAVFAESEISNLDSQIGIFAENCRLRKEMRDRGEIVIEERH